MQKPARRTEAAGDAGVQAARTVFAPPPNPAAAPVAALVVTAVLLAVFGLALAALVSGAADTLLEGALALLGRRSKAVWAAALAVPLAAHIMAPARTGRRL